MQLNDKDRTIINIWSIATLRRELVYPTHAVLEINGVECLYEDEFGNADIDTRDADYHYIVIRLPDDDR